MSNISWEPKCHWKLSFFKYYIFPSCWKRLVDGDPGIAHVWFGYYHKVGKKNTNQYTCLTCLFELRNIKEVSVNWVKPEVKGWGSWELEQTYESVQTMRLLFSEELRMEQASTENEMPWGRDYRSSLLLVSQNLLKIHHQSWDSRYLLYFKSTFHFTCNFISSFCSQTSHTKSNLFT